MLVRILLESLARRRRRKVLSALAVALGIAAAATVGTLSLDIGDKISRELRSYGANLSITPAADSLAISLGGVDYRPAGSGAFIAEAELVKLKKIFWRNNIVAFTPFLYVPAQVNGQSAVLIGTWFEKLLEVDKSEVFATGLKKLHPVWKVEGEWPDDKDVMGVLVGRRVAARLSLRAGSTITVTLAADSASNGETLKDQPNFPSALSELHRTSAAMKMREAPWSAVAPATALLPPSGRRQLRSASLPHSKALRASSHAVVNPSSQGSALRMAANGIGMPTFISAFHVRGVLETGGEEDDQVLAPLAAVQRLAGLEGKVRRVEVSALTKPEDAFARSDVSKLSAEEFDRWYCTPYVSSIAYQIQQAIPEAQVKPIYQVADTEGRILNRVGILMGVLALAGLVTAGLAVASMMLATVLERRAEIGLFKSLGATDARVATLLLLEAGVLGFVGGIAGYLLGSVLAWRLALAVFGVPIGIHLVMLPVCLALALAVTLAGSAIPLRRVLKLSPALVLRD
jgi:ABC-type antimicrobial peptide transport system permease subunit